MFIESPDYDMQDILDFEAAPSREALASSLPPRVLAETESRRASVIKRLARRWRRVFLSGMGGDNEDYFLVLRKRLKIRDVSFPSFLS